MNNAQKLANMIDGREYRDEITPEALMFAKDNKLLICTGASDDNISLSGAFSEEVLISSTGDFHVFKRGDSYQRLRKGHVLDEVNDSIGDNLLIDVLLESVESFFEKKGIKVEVNCDTEGYYFDLSGNGFPTFEITEDGEKYCIGCILDLSILE